MYSELDILNRQKDDIEDNEEDNDKRKNIIMTLLTSLANLTVLQRLTDENWEEVLKQVGGLRESARQERFYSLRKLFSEHRSASTSIIDEAVAQLQISPEESTNIKNQLLWLTYDFTLQDVPLTGTESKKLYELYDPNNPIPAIDDLLHFVKHINGMKRANSLKNPPEIITNIDALRNYFFAELSAELKNGESINRLRILHLLATLLIIDKIKADTTFAQQLSIQFQILSKRTTNR